MKLFQVDFLAKLSTLLKEAFKFKKYKAMHPAWAVFTGILMLPIVLVSFLLVALLAVISFVYALVSSPVKFLHEIVHHEGQSVKHATQAFLYLMSWPFIFLLYIVMSLAYIVLLPLYAAVSFFTYVWSLGGFKFHLFPQCADDIAIEVNGRYKPLPIVYVGIGAALLILGPAIHGLIVYIDLWTLYMEDLFLDTFLVEVLPLYVGALALFSILYSLIGFAPRPTAKALKDLAEEAPEEAATAEAAPAEEIAEEAAAAVEAEAVEEPIAEAVAE